MLAALHGCHGSYGVGVVGRGDHHGIYLLVQFVQHSPKVGEGLGLGMFLEDIACSFLVHIAQTDDVHPEASNILEVTSSLAADTDSGHIQLAIGFESEREPGFGQEEQSRSAED
jgi:hypothetical protein